MKSFKMSLANLALAMGAFSSVSTLHAAISFMGGSYAETFDSLPNSGTAATTWANDSTLPGWSLFRRPSPGTPLSLITPGTGSSNAGAFYSFGVSGDSDRALGGVGSGGNYWGNPGTATVAGWMAVALTNSTGSSVNEVTVAFDGEQWRDANTAAQTMVMEYGVGASFDTVAWTAPGGAFDFVSPQVANSLAINGNEASNRIAGVGGVIGGLPWGIGETLWIRWIENNDAGNDHGLAIDNFSLTAGTIQPPTDDADFNGDQVVDGQDFLIWQRGFGVGATFAEGNANGDGAIDAADLQIWQDQFGTPASMAAVEAVPEPASLGLAALGTIAALSASRRRA